MIRMPFANACNAMSFRCCRVILFDTMQATPELHRFDVLVEFPRYRIRAERNKIYFNICAIEHNRWNYSARHPAESLY